MCIFQRKRKLNILEYKRWFHSELIERTCSSVYVQVNFREFLQLILDGYFLNRRMDLERRFQTVKFLWNVFLEIDESIREIERLDSDTFVKIALLWRLRRRKHPPLLLLNRVHIRSIYDVKRTMSRCFVDVYRLKNSNVYYWSLTNYSYFASLFVIILYKLIIYLYLFLFLTPFRWILKRKLRNRSNHDMIQLFEFSSKNH